MQVWDVTFSAGCSRPSSAGPQQAGVLHTPHLESVLAQECQCCKLGEKQGKKEVAMDITHTGIELTQCSDHCQYDWVTWIQSRKSGSSFSDSEVIALPAPGTVTRYNRKKNSSQSHSSVFSSCVWHYQIAAHTTQGDLNKKGIDHVIIYEVILFMNYY